MDKSWPGGCTCLQFYNNRDKRQISTLGVKTNCLFVNKCLVGSSNFN